MRTLALVALLAVPCSAAVGQEKAVEMGLGITALGVNVAGGNAVLHFQANQQYVSAGLYLSPTLAIEPAVGISVTSGNGATLAVVSAGASVPIFTKATWGRSGLYFAPGVGVNIVSASGGGGSATESQFSAGLEVGTKIPVVDAVSLRLGGNVAYAFETDSFSSAFTLSAGLGVSVFFQ